MARTNLWNARVNGLAMSWIWADDFRPVLLRRFGLKVGEGGAIQPCFIGSAKVEIGHESYVGPGCFLDGSDQIFIGDRVSLAHEVMLVTSSHDMTDRRRRAGKAKNGSVTVGDGTWIGARAVVLPGVKIGAGCDIAAGALVTRDCEPDGLYVGSPARRVGNL